MFKGIDHLVILVRHLETAIQTYEGLGFQVTPGGQHPGGTHNALIGFADGSYIELIAFQEPDEPHDHRWYRFLSTGGGLVDFALLVDDVEQTLAEVRGRGLDYDGPNPGARRRPDGQELAWRMGAPRRERTGELPFLIDDVTARELRVPSGELTRHPNGVAGIQSLIIAVRDLDEAAQEFSALLGQEAGPRAADEERSAETRAFQVGVHQLVLAYPTGPASPLVTRIQRMGDGPYEALLRAEGVETHRRIFPEDAEGARFVLVPAR